MQNSRSEKKSIFTPVSTISTKSVKIIYHIKGAARGFKINYAKSDQNWILGAFYDVLKTGSFYKKHL